ncbi:hypothetical protein H5410_039683 [Solanum commersonii]|uniref:Uncharacterized protein n=1 Tax=Solanum commersonii TaxID=4109 RepID=A0A9J5XLN3_SOLCO|nr:hypothetical protein H5410_039683 [Solanum commersonii]
MNKGPVLNHQHRIDLCAPISDQDIWEGLQAIDDDKSPGNDGQEDKPSISKEEIALIDLGHD